MYLEAYTSILMTSKEKLVGFLVIISESLLENIARKNFMDVP